MGGGGGTSPKRLYGRLLIKRVGFKSSGKGKERGREGEREGERERGREGERERGREGGRERGRGYFFFVFLREIHFPYYSLIASLFTQEFVLSTSKLAS